jgi:rhodanese-related sulfurtransferase
MTTSDTSAHPAHLDAAALSDWLEDGPRPYLLDVREPAEFEAMHIPGAHNMPLGLLGERHGELLTEIDRVVLICASGKRAGTAERFLTSVGMAKVHVLDGGVTAWEAAGGPVARGRKRWHIERQVRLVAGSLVLLGMLSDLVVPGARWLAAAIGTGLVVAALTNTCTMGTLLSRLPFNRP